MAALILARDRRLGCRRGRATARRGCQRAGRRQAAARAGAARPSADVDGQTVPVGGDGAWAQSADLPGAPGRPLTGPPGRPQTTITPEGRSEPAAGPRLVARGPCARLCTTLDDGSRRPSSRRSGRVMVASHRMPGARAGSAPAERRPRSMYGQQVGAQPPARRRSRLRRRSRCHRAADGVWATIGPLSRPASMRHQADACLAIARRGWRPGSAVAPRCRGSSDGCRFSAPCGRQARIAGGHELAVVGEHEQVRAPAERRPRRAPGAAGARASRSADPNVSARRCTGVGGHGAATADRPARGADDRHDLDRGMPRRARRGWGPRTRRCRRSTARRRSRSRERCRRLRGPRRRRPRRDWATEMRSSIEIEVVDVQLARQVVELVLQRAREQASCRRP